MPHTRIRRYLRRGTLSQLGVLEAVLRHGNCTRAAEELFMAQPTVSIQLQKLRELVGMPLIRRVGRKLNPTEAGSHVLAAADKVLAALAELEDRLDALRGLKGGQVRLAVGTAARHFAPALLAEFARRYPAVEVSLQVQPRDTLLERLNARADDLYLFAHPPESGEHVRQAILANPMVVVARADHPLARTPAVPLARLAGEPFLMRETGSGTRMAVQRLFRENRLEPRVRMELSTDDAILQAVKAGLGVTVLSRHALGTEVPNGLTLLDVRDLPAPGHWYAVQPAGRQLSPAARALLELMRSEARKLASAGAPAEGVQEEAPRLSRFGNFAALFAPYGGELAEIAEFAALVA